MFVGSLEITNDQHNFTIKETTHTYHNILTESFDLPYKHHFYAKTVCSLEEFVKSSVFSIYTANLLLVSIYNQLHRLSRHHIAISFFDLNDILVIDSKDFYFCNTDKLYPISKLNNIITVTQLYDTGNRFLPPEFKSNNKMPLTCHKNTGFFSLASIVLHCLKHTNQIFSTFTTDDILDYYNYTKMSSTLNLCLSDKPENRHFIIF